MQVLFFSAGVARQTCRSSELRRPPRGAAAGCTATQKARSPRAQRYRSHPQGGAAKKSDRPSPAFKHMSFFSPRVARQTCRSSELRRPPRGAAAGCIATQKARSPRAQRYRSHTGDGQRPKRLPPHPHVQAHDLFRPAWRGRPAAALSAADRLAARGLVA